MTKKHDISSEELTGILDKFYKEIEKLQDNKQQITHLKDIITVLIHVNRSALETVVQHKFFYFITNTIEPSSSTMESEFKSR